MGQYCTRLTAQLNTFFANTPIPAELQPFLRDIDAVYRQYDNNSAGLANKHTLHSAMNGILNMSLLLLHSQLNYKQQQQVVIIKKLAQIALEQLEHKPHQEQSQFATCTTHNVTSVSNTSAPTSPAPQQARILLAGEQQDDVYTLLEELGYEVDHVTQGHAVLQALFRATNGTPYSALLMDLHLPVNDDCVTTHQIRRSEAQGMQYGSPHLPIIALTTQRPSNDSELLKGTDDCLCKPLNTEVLQQCLARVIISSTSTSTPPEKASIYISKTTDTSRVNLNPLRKAFGDNEQQLRQVVQIFLQEMKTMLQRIQTALDSQDAPRLRLEAHSLKSAVGNFGDKEAFELAYQLEQLGAAGDLAAAPTIYHKLREELVQTQNALQVVMGQSS